MWHCRSDVTCQQFPTVLSVPRSICAAAHPAYDCILPFEEEGRTYYKCGVELQEGGQSLNWCPVKTLEGNDAIKTCESGEAFSYQQLKYNSGTFLLLCPSTTLRQWVVQILVSQLLVNPILASHILTGQKLVSQYLSLSR